MTNDRCVGHFSSFAFCGFSVLFFSLSLSFLSSCLSLSVLSLSQLLHVFMCAPPSHPPSPSCPCSASLAPQPPTPPPSPAVRMQCVRPSLPADRPAAVRAPLRAHTPLISTICSSRMLLESVHIDTNTEPALFNPLPPSTDSRTLRPAPRRQPLAARPHGHTRSSLVRSPPASRATLCSHDRLLSVAGGQFGREGRGILALFFCLFV